MYPSMFDTFIVLLFVSPIMTVIPFILMKLYPSYAKKEINFLGKRITYEELLYIITYYYMYFYFTSIFALSLFFVFRT
jgi:hypothetical protein